MPRIAILSDTHGSHHEISIPPVDWLIHCGDFTNTGSQKELLGFNNWITELKQKGIIKKAIVGVGNHEVGIERDQHKSYYVVLNAIDHLLIHNYVEIDGFKIFATPYTPMFFNWAFMREEEDLMQFFNQIPEGLDFLISHGPPLGTRDKTPRPGGKIVHAGSWSLRDAIKSKKPKIVCCGHIHYGRGIEEIFHEEDKSATIVINAANMDENYMTLPAIILDIPCK